MVESNSNRTRRSICFRDSARPSLVNLPITGALEEIRTLTVSDLNAVRLPIAPQEHGALAKNRT